jgi:excisionase family DNA binding protein
MDGSRNFLNVGQAAEYLGVSPASLRNWSDQGKLPVYRTPGGQRRYRIRDLDAFIESWREARGDEGEEEPERPVTSNAPRSSS